MIRKIFLSILVLIVLLFVTAIALSFFYSKEIKQYVITAINKNLNAEIIVSEIDFSLLSNFPYASVEFSNLISKEPKQLNTHDTLLNAKQLSLLFNLFDLISKNYVLQKIVLTDAQLNLKINKDGENNYHIWKTDSADSGDNFKMEIEKLRMENVHVNYKSIHAEQDYSFKINEGDLAGNFIADKYSVKATADLMVEKIISGKINWVKNKEAKIDLLLNVDDGKDLYTIEKSAIKLAGLDLTVAGTILSPEGFDEYDLTIESKDANLKSLLSVIPAEYNSNLNDYNFKGSAVLKTTIKGRSDKKHDPVFIVNFGTENSSVSPKNSDYHLTGLKFTGFYTSSRSEKNPVSYLSLKNVRSVLNGQAIIGNLEIENFKNPFLRFEADAKADLSILHKFITIDTLENILGSMDISNAKFSGRVNDNSTYISTGNITFNNVSFKFKQKPVVFSAVNGNLVLSKNNLQIISLEGKTPQSNFMFAGNLDNFFGYFFAKNQKLNVTASMRSQNLDLNEIMEKDAATSANDTIYKITFSKDLAFSFNVDIAKLNFNKFNSSGVKGRIELNNGMLSTHALQFSSMDGNVLLQGSIREIPNDSLVIQYDATVKNLDITKLFYQMGNFGQQVITDKNLKGNVTADVQFLSHWSNTLDCNLDKVHATATITIENGRLVNFSPMLALSKYVKGADLNDISFSTLKNTIEMKDRKVIIPGMEINSSALNITANGVHGFDNMIDYHLQLLLSQLMGKKVKNMNTEFGTIEDDNLGRTKIFISMKGPAANPKFSYDSKGLKEKISTDIKKERETLKEILKKEFVRKDSLPDKKEQKKQEELEIDTSEGGE
ncbi:MAG: AsmA-like C-terminal region-containing protein [Bacteroidia bacterium]